MTDKSLCDSCTNIGCEFQSGIVRTKCAFYMPPQLEPDNCGNYVVQDSTTKNCESCRYYGLHHEVCNYCYKCSLWTEKELTTKNDLGVDCISIDKQTFNDYWAKTGKNYPQIAEVLKQMKGGNE